jgi:hypothetical protein
MMTPTRSQAQNSKLGLTGFIKHSNTTLQKMFRGGVHSRQCRLRDSPSFEGSVMPFSFAAPEDLAQLEASLERAWTMIVKRYGHDPSSGPAERERLAYVVATLWQPGTRECVAEQAVARFEATAPSLMPLAGADPEPRT